MSILPIDMQLIYAQQATVSRSEHARMAERALTMQAEDLDIDRDSYQKDATVVATDESTPSQLIRRRREGRRGFLYMHYRKKKGRKGEEVIAELEDDLSPGKGRIINILQ
ncbi:MAG: hypothetical protein HZC28_07460 [Spirochaetes bacterium]|nr:hypothetical protein [Spirochaetota bacterium]